MKRFLWNFWWISYGVGRLVLLSGWPLWAMHAFYWTCDPTPMNVKIVTTLGLFGLVHFIGFFTALETFPRFADWAAAPIERMERG